jgi:hypothetical protein
MSHIRTRIRQNLVTTLTGLANTGSNCFDTRVFPMHDNVLPGICVYTVSETSRYPSMRPPRTLQKRLSARIEVYVKMTSTYDEMVDQISADIEEALHTDLTRNSLAIDTRIVSFDTDFSANGDQPVMVGRLSCEIDYLAVEGSPEG